MKKATEQGRRGASMETKTRASYCSEHEKMGVSTEVEKQKKGKIKNKMINKKQKKG